MSTNDDGIINSFDTGATRDTSEGKLDMEGFTHPMVEKQFAKYMNMNRLQSDGQLRDSDNWQKGIPKVNYMKSLRRHHDDAWSEHRGFDTNAGMIAALCGIIFNAKGMLHEILKERGWELQDFDGDEPTPEMAERISKLTTPEKDKLTTPDWPVHMRDNCCYCIYEILGPDEHPCNLCHWDENSLWEPNAKAHWVTGVIDLEEDEYKESPDKFPAFKEDWTVRILNPDAKVRIERKLPKFTARQDMPPCFKDCSDIRCRSECPDHDRCDDFICDECDFEEECMILKKSALKGFYLVYK